MAEYFEKQEEAEAYIRRASKRVLLYARIQLHGSEKWMVDHERRNLGSSIVIEENLSHRISDIEMAGESHLEACPNCRATDSPYGADVALRVYRCSCEKVYCDRCSAGGLVSLPRCPVSAYHEGMRNVSEIPPKAAAKPPATEPPPSQTSQGGRKPPVSPPPSPPPADESVRPTGMMKAEDAAEALRVLFDRALPAVPQLSDERVQHFHNDWDGGSGGRLHLKPTDQMRLLVAAHLRNLASQAGFEDFRIQAHDRWRCAFVEAFRSTPRSVSLLLLWRKLGGELAAAATAAFPPSDDDATRAERWLAGLAHPAESTKAQVEADLQVKIGAPAKPATERTSPLALNTQAANKADNTDVRRHHAAPQPKGQTTNDKPEQQQSPQPPPSPSSDEQRAREKAATEGKVISGCAFAGAATFIVLNLATGVVPGGFIGGAIGGGLGAVVGVIVNSLRGK